MKKFLLIFFILFGFWANAQTQNISSIQFLGLKKIDSSYLQKLIKTRINQPLDSLRLQEDILTLIREPAISNASFQVAESKNDYSLTFSIEENQTLIPTLSAWKTLEDNVAYHVGITHFNLFGKGYIGGVFYRQNNFPGFGIIFENNNFIKPENELKLIASQLETYEPILKNQQSSIYRYRLQSIEISFGKEFTLYHKGIIGIGLSKEHYNYALGDQLNQVPRNFSTKKVLLKLGNKYDFVLPYYYFNKGWKNDTHFTYVWGPNVENSNRFYALENTFSFYKRIQNSGNLALRLSLGLARNEETPLPPYVIDNNRNVRGVGNLIKRGSAYWTINAEYRHRLYEKQWFTLQSNTFVDLAGIRPAGDQISSIIDNENTYAYGGIGLRFIHKYIYKAIIRLDFGVDLNGSNHKGFVFGIDQYF